MTIVPDTKDWTWVLARPCPECGFDTQAFPRESIGALIRANAAQWVRIVAGAGYGAATTVAVRPRPDKWSPLEYACHVRDAFQLYAYWLDLMLTQDDPLYPTWDQDAAAVAERYGEQDPVVVAWQIAEAGEALATAFDGVQGDQWDRPGRRSDGARFVVESFGRFFVHEPVHHLWDVTGVRAAPAPSLSTSQTDGKVSPLPRLERSGGATRLIVDGKPFLIRGGELGNSSVERAYLASRWRKIAAMNLNTVLAPVYWDVVEPVEGEFNWTTVDAVIEDARSYGMRIVLLWFGSWKNSMSCYAPGWVKTDVARFPRCLDSAGRSMEILTPFSEANRDADAKAFAALMRHLREFDRRHTVVMVQVENEIGMIPEARDHSPLAETAFAAPVPAALMNHLQQHRDKLAPELRERWLAAGGRTRGKWTEVLGEGPATEELFMAWAFARYVQAVAAAGRTQLDLPMYTNAALIRPGYQPGQYPSGGPLPHLIDVWRAGAPALDFISPDIYFPNFAEWADRYVRGGNPLFIPEALRSVDAAANALYAFGQHAAIGFAPFGIESIEGRAERMLAGSFDVIRQLEPLIAEHAGQPTMAGLLPQSEQQVAPHRILLGGLVLEVAYECVAAPSLADGVINEAGDRAADRTRLPAGAIAIQTGPDEFVFGGIGVTVTFSSPPPGKENIGILRCEEGTFEAGAWRHLRWLNGDQTHQGRHLRLEPGRFAIQRIKLYRYR